VPDREMTSQEVGVIVDAQSFEHSFADTRRASESGTDGVHHALDLQLTTEGLVIDND